MAISGAHAKSARVQTRFLVFLPNIAKSKIEAVRLETCELRNGKIRIFLIKETASDCQYFSCLPNFEGLIMDESTNYELTSLARLAASACGPFTISNSLLKV